MGRGARAVEDMARDAVILPDRETLRVAYAGRRVLLTGHTGFKGGWLAVWLRSLAAEVTGVALDPDTEPSLFEDAGIADVCRHVVGDVRDLALVRRLVRGVRPEAVFHLAAQSLVRRSYAEPMATLETNVTGTANVLEAIRLERQRCAVVVVTSDKCYENAERLEPYRESDPMGGSDVYSASKGAAEIVARGWRRSFFPPARLAEHGVAVATARAGNVIGGGDWCADRIVPDAIRALAAGRPVPVRNPASVRPWQHVLEPLGGYLLLGARLLGPDAARHCGPWNFGPAPEDAAPVSALVGEIIRAWGSGSWAPEPQPGAPREAGLLRLSADKAREGLGWGPRWDLRAAVERSVAFYRARASGARGAALREECLRQVEEYLGAGAGPP